MKRYPVNEFNIGKNVYPKPSYHEKPMKPMRIHQQIEHECIIAINNWLTGTADKILRIFSKGSKK